MNLCQSHVLVSQPLLKIRGANLKLKNPRFIANISPGISIAIEKILYFSQRTFILLKPNSLSFDVLAFVHCVAFKDRVK